MKILQVINIRWYNAEADYCLKLAKQLDSLDMHDITVMGIKGSPVINKATELGLKTVTDIDLNCQSPFSVIANYFKMKKFLRAEKFDLINFHRSEGFIIGALAARAADAKVVRTRGDVRPVRKGVINRFLYDKLTDRVIASGNVIKESLTERLGILEEKISTIYTAVDTDRFTSAKRSDKLKDELKIAKNRKIIAILGRLGDVKGHDHFIRAARIVKDSHSDALFLIIGKEIKSEGAGLPELISELKLSDDVRFIMGMRDDIAEIAASVDVGVITSTGSEANCRVAIEWLSSGIPVVAFKTGVIPEVITDCFDGYLVETGEYVLLAEKIHALLSDDNTRARFSANARVSAKERFRLDKFADETLELYKSVLKE